jgi:hypothetical protein
MQTDNENQTDVPTTRGNEVAPEFTAEGRRSIGRCDRVPEGQGSV